MMNNNDNSHNYKIGITQERGICQNLEMASEKV